MGPVVGCPGPESHGRDIDRMGAEDGRRGARAAIRCGTKQMQDVRLFSVAQAQANQGSLLAPVHSLEPGPDFIEVLSVVEI